MIALLFVNAPYASSPLDSSLRWNDNIKFIWIPVFTGMTLLFFLDSRFHGNDAAVFIWIPVFTGMTLLFYLDSRFHGNDAV